MTASTAAEIELREATTRFLAEIAPATDAQWRFRASPSGWSMADVCEHVVISTDTIGRTLAKRLVESPLGDRTVSVSDGEIPYLFYRGEEPPEVAAPTGALADAAAAAEALEGCAGAILRWARGVAVDLRTVGLPHPAFGLLDGVQWLSFVAAHMERHRAQILGLKRQRGFPS